MLKPIVLKTAFWALIIFTLALTLMPAKQVPNIFVFWDKLQHSLCFAALAISGQLAYKNLKKIAIGLIIFGLLIELMQTYLTTTRYGEPLDWLADCVGILFGLFIFTQIKKCGFWPKINE